MGWGLRRKIARPEFDVTFDAKASDTQEGNDRANWLTIT